MRRAGAAVRTHEMLQVTRDEVNQALSAMADSRLDAPSGVVGSNVQLTSGVALVHMSTHLEITWTSRWSRRIVTALAQNDRGNGVGAPGNTHST